MKLLYLLAALYGLAGANPNPHAPRGTAQELVARIPTSYESAVLGRRILGRSKLGTFSTVLPKSSNHNDPKAWEKQPEGMGGVPIGLMDYIADCEEEGNPTVLAINIGTSFKNVRAGSDLSISIAWIPPYPPAKRISLMSRLSAYLPFLYRFCPTDTASHIPDAVPYSAANLPRFSLMGHLEPIDADESTASRLEACYIKKHPDAKYWTPGNHIHKSEWMRFVVTAVYWVGGFGDRAYIGWIDVEEWKNVTRYQWESARLPGEKKGWSEWDRSDRRVVN